MTDPSHKDDFIELARQAAPEGKKPPHGLWALLGAVISIFGSQIIGVTLLFLMLSIVMSPDFVEQVMNNPELLETNLSSPILALVLISTTVLALISGLLWVIFFEKRSLTSFGLPFTLQGMGKFFRGLLLGLAAMSIGVYFLTLTGNATLSAPQLPDMWLSLWPLLLVALGWIIQSSSEEVIFRGLLFQSVSARHGLLIGALTSATLFALLHGMNPNTNALFFANLVLYSLFCCFYVLREGSLWGVCGYHAAWNFSQGHIFGIPVSGTNLTADKLMQFTPTGPETLTGGAAGLEGGLAASLAILLSAVIILGLTQFKKSD